MDKDNFMIEMERVEQEFADTWADDDGSVRPEATAAAYRGYRGLGFTRLEAFKAVQILIEEETT